LTTVTQEKGGAARQANPSLAKSLFLGHIPGEMIAQPPEPGEPERQRIRELIASFRELARDAIDERRIEADGWPGKDLMRELGERGLMGLAVPVEYGGQGLSKHGYYRVFEEIAEVDMGLAIVLGIHQSIGITPLLLFGNDEQKERLLPDLAAGRRLAGFALSELDAGSDAFAIQARAQPQADGSWLLDGEKLYVGNGSGHVFTVFARVDDGDEGRPDRHVALVAEAPAEGFSVEERHSLMGVCANDVRRLCFRSVRIPPENVLGEVGRGFKIAVETLNHGRMGLGCLATAASRRLSAAAIEHVTTRRQFGAPLASLELVQKKVAGWVTNLYGLESACYATVGLVDAGVRDFSLESAICKVSCSEFALRLADEALQLAGGEGYLSSHRYEKVYRDLRVFPIFEGTNDVLRVFIALSGMRRLMLSFEGERMLDQLPKRPVPGELRRRQGELALVATDGASDAADAGPMFAHRELAPLERNVRGQVEQLSATADLLLHIHEEQILERQHVQQRLADAVSDIYAQLAAISRTTALLDGNADAARQHVYVAESFCREASARVWSNLSRCERNDDMRITGLAQLAYERGAANFAYTEDERLRPV
jgi:acyl-CoA dehydrogenase family member 9